MYIMAIIIVISCNIAAAILYFAAAIIRFGIRFIEACVNKAPMVIGTITVFGKKLVKELAAFFNSLYIRVKIYTAKAAYGVIDTVREVINNADYIYNIIRNKVNSIVEKTVNDVKATKKYINFRVDSIKARHGGNAVAIIKKQGNVIDCLKDSIHEAIEFRKEVMAECR